MRHRREESSKSEDPSSDCPLLGEGERSFLCPGRSRSSDSHDSLENVLASFVPNSMNSAPQRVCHDRLSVDQTPLRLDRVGYREGTSRRLTATGEQEGSAKPSSRVRFPPSPHARELAKIRETRVRAEPRVTLQTTILRNAGEGRPLLSQARAPFDLGHPAKIAGVS